MVAIDPWQDRSPHWITIGSTNWTGAKSATEHLLELGHRRIGWLGGPRGNEASAERLHGYTAALQSAAIPLDESIQRHGDFEFEFGRLSAIELLRLCDRQTALVAANDEIAIGAIDGARAIELSIPGDVSITGFDDTPQASWATPKLTSVRQPLADMGRMAVSMITETVRGGPPQSPGSSSWSLGSSFVSPPPHRTPPAPARVRPPDDSYRTNVGTRHGTGSAPAT